MLLKERFQEETCQDKRSRRAYLRAFHALTSSFRSPWSQLGEAQEGVSHEKEFLGSRRGCFRLCCPDDA